jgi:PEP-CTERM motif
MKRLVLASAAVALLGWVTPVQATPITSDTVELRAADGVTVKATSSLSEGLGSPCTWSGPGGSITFQCETTSVSVPFTFATGTYPADVGIFLTNPDGSLSDFVTVDLTTFSPATTGIGMAIYSDVDGSRFPSVAQFLSVNANIPTASLPETGDFQNLTVLALGLVPPFGFGGLTVSPAPQVSAFSFWAKSDLASEPVPEPATLTLTTLGLAGAFTRYRRRRHPPSSL